MSEEYDDRFEQLRSDMAEGYLSKAEEKLIKSIETDFIDMKKRIAELRQKYKEARSKVRETEKLVEALDEANLIKVEEVSE